MGWKIRARQKQDNARQGKAGRALEYWSAGPLEHWPLKHKPLGLWNIRLLGHQIAGAQNRQTAGVQDQYRTSTRPLDHWNTETTANRDAGSR